MRSGMLGGRGSAFEAGLVFGGQHFDRILISLGGSFFGEKFKVNVESELHRTNRNYRLSSSPYRAVNTAYRLYKPVS